MPVPKAPNLEEINYFLDENKIAKYPLAKRDESKLLIYRANEITDSQFMNLPDILSSDSGLFFNNTKVIPARLFFQKETGAQIEIFLLNPISPTHIISLIMESTQRVIWKCMIGNLKKWKDDSILKRQLEYNNKTLTIEAKIVDRESRSVEFSWSDKSLSFAEVVELTGKVPLPPYLNRQVEPSDKERYQTVYSKEEGAVAAPTAGLHFTDEVLGQLQSKGVNLNYLTLHVSAGTFQPIKAKDAREHNMHSEQIEVDLETIQKIIDIKEVVAVGTTSMRTLESLYWFGNRLINGNEEFAIEKLEPYQSETQLPSKGQAFQAIYDWMISTGQQRIAGKTEIFIIPGYQFRVCNGLITNFHQPGSTLMLLVWAFVGDKWKHIYKHALTNDYRFLSYGDSSILLP